MSRSTCSGLMPKKANIPYTRAQSQPLVVPYRDYEEGTYDLVDNVVPVALGAKVLGQQGVQVIAHPDDTVSHLLDLAQPIRFFLWGGGSCQKKCSETDGGGR
jgi:hypothetical protein